MPRDYKPRVERLYEVEYITDSGHPSLAIVPGTGYKFDDEHAGRLTIWHHRKPTIFHQDRWIRLAEITPDAQASGTPSATPSA